MRPADLVIVEDGRIASLIHPTHIGHPEGTWHAQYLDGGSVITEADVSIIYRPKGRAGEYAEWAANLYRGCNSQCTYCFGASVLRMKKEDFDNPVPRKDILDRLEKSAKAMQNANISVQVLLSFVCDVYQPLDDELQITREAIKILHNHGLFVVVLTKGGKRALRDIDLFGPGDAFAATLTLLDPEQSTIWEPNAAPPQERIETLKAFHDAGIRTWASLEPVIDPAATLEIIRQTHNFVDSYKVGKMNYIGKLPEELREQVKDIDWGKFAHDAIELLEQLAKDHYIKEDLKAYV